MSEHTPGPWTWTADDAGPEDEYGTKTRGPVDISTYRTDGYVHNVELRGPNDEDIVGCTEYCILGCEGEERAANARLIAAAPELLAALRETRFRARDWAGRACCVGCLAPRVGASVPCKPTCVVEAAIAKAEGRDGAK